VSDLFVGMSGPELASGAGPVETITGIVDGAINGGPAAAGGQALTLGLQALGFMDNPLQALTTSAIGWVVEHLAPLNFALDATTGDPAAVDAAAKGFVGAATQLDVLATEHAGSLSCDLQTYFSAATGTDDVSTSARAFHGVMTTRFEDLRTASAACSGIASLIIVSGEVVATTRGVIRDMLAEFAWKRLQKAAVMLAVPPPALGAASGWFLYDTIVDMGRSLGKIGRVLSEMVGRLQHIAGRLKELSGVLATVLKSPLRQSVLNNSVTEFGKTVDKVVQQDRPGSAANAEMPELPPTPEEKAEEQPPAFPSQQPPPSRPVYGPPSNARWTTSGTLDG
jgi:hypothetical protein